MKDVLNVYLKNVLAQVYPEVWSVHGRGRRLCDEGE